MHSIRSKITLMTVVAIIITLVVAALLASVSVRNLGNSTSNQILLLMCETGQKNLNAYFDSISQSVKTVSDFANSNLSETDLKDFATHLDRVEKLFEKTAKNTAGVLTYYYRIDPSVDTTEKGFWYVNLDGEGFESHEVTDITLYDTEDQSALVWFTVPKATGKPIWLPPYVTDNLDVFVMSYNVPIYKGDMFVGVIGIEIDYSTIAEQVSNITLYNNGYAFIDDNDGNVIYHPRMNMEEVVKGNFPKASDGLVSDSSYIFYKYDGVDKQAVWLPLDNGMRLYVTVPISEINASWYRLINEIIGVSIVLIIIAIAFAAHFSKRITQPLSRLTEAAEQVNEGNYDFEVDYTKDDEVGMLTNTFGQLASHLKVYINDLNNLAYSDALTSVHNKGSFDVYIREMQVRINDPDQNVEFAVGIFDCNRLKLVNDRFGHDKGDIYLKAASSLICQVFHHSPVFRTGGDEFAVIMQNDDYRNREALMSTFVKKSAELNASASDQWEQVSVAMGVAAYDPTTDKSVDDVIRRADRLMYKNKQEQRAAKK